MPGEDGHLAVFRPDRAVRLDNGNLVDLLTAERFSHKIERVRWSGSALSVDFTVSGADTSPDGMYLDLKRLVHAAFKRTTNAQRLLVRFAEERGNAGRPVLLLAADARRTDGWLTDDYDRLEEADLGRDPVWRQRLRMTFSHRWTERFGPPGSGS